MGEQTKATWDDNVVRKIFAVLIDASWESPDFFSPLQEAWHILAREWGIEDIEDNGHGRVIRKK